MVLHGAAFAKYGNVWGKRKIKRKKPTSFHYSLLYPIIPLNPFAFPLLLPLPGS